MSEHTLADWTVELVHVDDGFIHYLVEDVDGFRTLCGAESTVYGIARFVTCPNCLKELP